MKKCTSLRNRLWVSVPTIAGKAAFAIGMHVLPSWAHRHSFKGAASGSAMLCACECAPRVHAISHAGQPRTQTLPEPVYLHYRYEDVLQGVGPIHVRLLSLLYTGTAPEIRRCWPSAA